MKHILRFKTVRSGGKLRYPGDEVDLPKDFLIQLGELDADGNELPGAPAPAPDVSGQVAELQSQVDDLTKQVADLEARHVLPDDALERLKAVDGIGDKLAQKALDSLTVKPAGK